MPTTVINDFSIEPKAEPPSPERASASAKGGGGKGSSDTAREIERVLRHNRHRDLRLWTY